MSTPGGQNLVIRIAVADAASIPVARINENLAATGVTAAAASAKTVTALAQTDAALNGTAARAAALGEANTAAAAAASGAWTRTSTAIATAGSAAAATGSKVAAATELMKPLLAMVAAFGAIKFLGGSVDAGKDDLLGIRLVKQEFGEAANEVLEFGEKAAQAFGMSAAATDKMTAKFGQYLTSMGLANSKDFPEMSMQLTKVTADIARYNGVSVDDAAAAVQSGIANRTRALKALGIGIDAAAISQAALNHHLGDSSGQLSTAETNMAKYYAVIDGAAKQIGSMDKANGSLSKSQAQVSASLENLQGEIGQGIVPVLSASASLINTAVVPGFTMMFHVISPVFSLFSVLPAPIQATTAAMLLLVALRGPLTTMLTALSDRLYLAAASFSATGLAGATSTALLGLSKFAGFMAGPWGLAITAGIVLLTSFFKNSDEAAKSQLTFGDVIDSNTGKLNTNTAAVLNNQVANTGIGDQLALLGSTVQEYSEGLDGTEPTQKAFAKRINDMKVAAVEWNAANEPMSGLLSGHSDQYKKNEKTISAADAVLKQFTTDTKSLNDELRHRTQATEETTDATLDVMDAQDIAKASAVELAKTAADMTVTYLPPLIEKVNTLRLGWASMDDQVNTVISTLDKLAGRDAPVEQAVGNMYKALRDQASQFKLGQAGATRLDPTKLYNADGTINQRSAAGNELYTSLQSDQTAITTAGIAAYDQMYAKTGDLTKARAAATKVVTDGYAAEEKNLTLLLGSKDAADALMKTYGHWPATVVTTIIANTNQADTALTATGQKVAAVTGAPNPATAPSTSGTAQGQTTVTVPAPGGPGTSTYDEQVPKAASTPLTGAGSAGSAEHDSAGSKWPAAVERWRPQVLRSLSIMGEPATEAETVMYRINLESSGNPNAVNRTDSNARAGHASEGLVQVIPSTFEAYGLPGYNTNILDPLSNLLAGENYSKHKYGSVVAGFGRAGGYDNGGWLPPGGIAISNLPTPEPILSTAQWGVAEAAINHVTATAQTGGTTVTIEKGAIVVNGDPSDDDLAELEQRISEIFRRQLERAHR